MKRALEIAIRLFLYIPLLLAGAVAVLITMGFAILLGILVQR